MRVLGGHELLHDGRGRARCDAGLGEDRLAYCILSRHTRRDTGGQIRCLLFREGTVYLASTTEQHKVELYMYRGGGGRVSYICGGRVQV